MLTTSLKLLLPISLSLQSVQKTLIVPSVFCIFSSIPHCITAFPWSSSLDVPGEIDKGSCSDSFNRFQGATDRDVAGLLMETLL
jgi:hypothetical protein